jgi:hypothetical protein
LANAAAAGEAIVKWPGLGERDLLGVRFAVNVFIATAILWYLLRNIADTNPIWSIASMVAASEPQVKEATRMFRSRIINVLVGCGVGLLFLLLGGAGEWKLPLARDGPRLVVRDPRPDDVASSADHGGYRNRGWPDPPLQGERGGARAAQGGGGDSGLRDGTVRELDHVPGLALAGAAGQGRVDQQGPGHQRICWSPSIKKFARIPYERTHELARQVFRLSLAAAPTPVAAGEWERCDLLQSAPWATLVTQPIKE